ncbi:small-conductance mechanosensitive channel [Xenococcus sp. PCC 7305]|uniref:mechanosensitive ion channel family protein n=1 Tax=Xenococcus sp. PCC 7305 TaxID=102125 RepID=UPI0002AC09BD|nr:mechanosensitive ion channel domain-containing protein [Xenococcus sp. PCC 7305]ELS01031.1 small-conductance mechanosensitive channel [Xenococcus sp. PCC 7305]
MSKPQSPFKYHNYIERFAASPIAIAYKQIVEPYFSLIQIFWGLAIAEFILLLVKPIVNLSFLEIILSLSIGITTCYLGYQIIGDYFRLYIGNSLDKGRKLDAEFLLVAKFSINSALVFIVITIFAVTHEIDIFGLLASIGIGGVAIAFAAQKILEQIIGGIVLFFDSPFAIDDYIKLPDGTFGRVESIGLRLTKIRTSGKGTLVSVPNNSLTQENVENFTNAGKIMAMVHLTFPQGISIDQKALLHQLIITASKDIWGIDPRSTAINFSDLNAADKMQAQVSFCILSSGNELSTELRSQILQIAGSKISKKLDEFGIAHEIKQPSEAINLPINI